MGSKRSSKNPTNPHSSPPPSNPTVDLNSPNPKNSIPLTPPKSHKKQKLSAPVPNDSNHHRKQTSTDFPNDASPPSVSVAAPRPTAALRWTDSENLKLLQSIIALQTKGLFSLKGGFSLKPSITAILLKEIKNWAPGPISEKKMDSKIRHLRFKFQRSPKPGPESSEFDRTFYDLASKLWVLKGDEDVVVEEEEKDVLLENGEVNEKDELLVEDNSYTYLKLALEEYWRESKFNIETLYAALPKVNHEQAKRLDENFREVFLGMLKLKMDKNKVSNEIIHASLGC